MPTRFPEPSRILRGRLLPTRRSRSPAAALGNRCCLKSDDAGKFTVPALAPGTYTVRVTKDGFQESRTSVEVRGFARVEIKLVIAEQVTGINVSEKSLAFANSDSVYRQLRDVDLGASYRCENFKFTMDVGTFELKSGTLTFLNPVNQLITGAVFVGEGHFTLKPVSHSDELEITRRAGSGTAEEDFHEAVFRFTGSFHPKLSANLTSRVDTPREAATALQHWRERLRHRHEAPEGFNPKPSTTWTLTFLPPFITISILYFSTPTWPASRTKICGSSCVCAPAPFHNSIRPRRLR